MLWQLCVNGIIAGGVLALMAIGFALVYRVSKFFHFAHGAVFTAGAYFALVFKASLNLSLAPSILLSVISCMALGCAMEWGIYAPLKRKKASSTTLLLASLGIYVVLQNLVSMIFGDDIKTIRSGIVLEGIDVLGARITPIQMLIVGVSLALVFLVAGVLGLTSIGRAMRAVANDADLSSVSGIPSNRITLWALGVGSGLAGIAGILFSLDVDMIPTMGMNTLMLGVVAVIIGGVGSIPGVALGALLLGMAQHVGVWKINSQWQEAISFFVLLLFLLFKPEGFLGKKSKRVSV